MRYICDMKRIDRVVEAVYRKLLRETSLDDLGGGMAAFVYDAGGSKEAVVYDIKKLAAAIEAGKLDFTGKDSYVVGFVQIKQPRGAQCRGAWQVAAISGPGKIVYSIAYALSPAGVVVPDRSNVSPSASDAWKRYSAGAEKAGNMLPLDDADHPAKGTDPHHDKYHTPGDESDDCYTSHSEPWLNAAYRGAGGETAFLDKLNDSHLSAVPQLAAAAGMKQEDLEGAILDAGYSHFDLAMGY